MAFVNEIPPQIRAEAAAWLARLRADDKNAIDEAAFRVWLASDARHPRAFEAVTEAWELAGAAWSEPVVGPQPVLRNRRAVLAGAGSLAVAAIGFTFWQSAEAGVFETGIGEQKHAVLPCGTQVFLDTDTRIHTSYDSTSRVVTLERGRCNFHVLGSDSRPFAVDASDERIAAARATFDVRRDGDTVCVVLTQGLARIDAKNGSWRENLTSGDRVVAGHGGRRKDRPSLVPLLAWQMGQVVFDNDTVASAIHEMNRYSVVKLAVEDTDIAQMRISGVYRVGDNAAFAHSVATLLPVMLEFNTDQVRLELDPARVKKT
ncbi:MAG: FecR domain-containing protein [Rhizomicrobium sp.]|nr:FecR domain-containing protein [Rhizomicrobium sp.]